MNTYHKFAPNVWVAKCTERHQKGDVITVATQYGKENECIVHNLVGQRDGCLYYSITRADGFNTQEWAKRRAERLQGAAGKAQQRSAAYLDKANEGREFLILGEPIKVGHHSEKRHRALIGRNHARIHNAMRELDKAQEYEQRAAYWESKAETINLSMPESLQYYEFRLEQARAQHDGLKNGSIKREHSYSLTYAKKAVNEAEKNLELAKRLWA